MGSIPAQGGGRQGAWDTGGVVGLGLGATPLDRRSVRTLFAAADSMETTTTSTTRSTTSTIHRVVCEIKDKGPPMPPQPPLHSYPPTHLPAVLDAGRRRAPRLWGHVDVVAGTLSVAPPTEWPPPTTPHHTTTHATNPDHHPPTAPPTSPPHPPHCTHLQYLPQVLNGGPWGQLDVAGSLHAAGHGHEVRREAHAHRLAGCTDVGACGFGSWGRGVWGGACGGRGAKGRRGLEVGGGGGGAPLAGGVREWWGVGGWHTGKISAVVSRGLAEEDEGVEAGQYS